MRTLRNFLYYIAAAILIVLASQGDIQARLTKEDEENA